MYFMIIIISLSKKALKFVKKVHTWQFTHLDIKNTKKKTLFSVKQYKSGKSCDVMKGEKIWILLSVRALTHTRFKTKYVI